MPGQHEIRQRVTKFTFVQCSKPTATKDHMVRRAIQQHVMRDIGRARRRKPRFRVVDLGIVDSTDSKGHNFANDTNISSITNALTSTQCGGLCSSLQSDPNLVPGVDLTVRDRELLHFMRAEIDLKYRAFHVVWIRAGLSDSTCLYLSLASATVALDQMSGRQNADLADNVQTNRYYRKALGQLNARISDLSEFKSAGVITTILGFMCHDTNINDWSRWQTHMKGLKALADARGGFDDLENYIPIMAWWLDLVGCSALDHKPQFPIPRDLVVSADLDKMARQDLEQCITKVANSYPELLPILQILTLMHGIAETVYKHGKTVHFWQDEVGGIGLIGPTIYNLLIMPRIAEFHTSQQPPIALYIQELLRLTFLMLLSGLKQSLSLNASDMIPLREKFSTIWPCLENTVGVLQDMMLWAWSTSSSLPHHKTSRSTEIGSHFVLAIRSLMRIISAASQDIR